MNAKTKLACILIALVCVGSLMLGAAYVGTRIERNKYTAIVASLKLEHSKYVATTDKQLGELGYSVNRFHLPTQIMFTYRPLAKHLRRTTNANYNFDII